MSDKKITDLTELTTPAIGDKLPIVDISDTTDATTGTTKYIQIGNMPSYYEEIEAASDALSAEQCTRGMINNYGQTDDVTLTLPAAAAGYNFIVVLGTTVAKYFRLDPDAGDKIYLDGVADTDGHYCGIASAVAGAAIQLIAFQTGAGEYDWLAMTISGAWVME